MPSPLGRESGGAVSARWGGRGDDDDDDNDVGLFSLSPLMELRHDSEDDCN